MSRGTFVSEMLGDTTIVHMRKTQIDSINNFGSTSYTRQEHRRPLMTPDEVMRIDEREDGGILIGAVETRERPDDEECGSAGRNSRHDTPQTVARPSDDRTV